MFSNENVKKNLIRNEQQNFLLVNNNKKKNAGNC